MSLEQTCDRFDIEALQIWSHNKVVPEQFYQTGFEIIPINDHRDVALKTVLSSLINWDEELLICGDHVSRDSVIHLANQQGIVCQPYFEFPDDPAVLSNILDARPFISHLLLSISDASLISNELVATIIGIRERYKLNLIINCNTAIGGFNEIFKGSVDFFIGVVDGSEDHSYVIARRSRLVQTEGNSRSFNHDLYALWQRRVVSRKSLIEPMCVC